MYRIKFFTKIKYDSKICQSFLKMSQNFFNISTNFNGISAKILV